jgi:hypothetical protein
MFCDVPLFYLFACYIHWAGYKAFGCDHLLNSAVAHRVWLTMWLWLLFGMTLYPFYHMIHLLPLQPTPYKLCILFPFLEAGHLTRTLQAYHI